MLKPLARVIGLTITFALLIFAARVIGQAQPPPALQELHLTDCQLPCWSGITPGKTTFAEALQQLKAIYPQAAVTINPAQAALQFRLASARIGIGVFADKLGVVSDLLLYAYDFNGLALGDVVTLLKLPAQLYGTSPMIAIPICPSSLIGISGSTTGAGWQRPLAVLEIQNTNVDQLCR